MGRLTGEKCRAKSQLGISISSLAVHAAMRDGLRLVAIRGVSGIYQKLDVTWRWRSTWPLSIKQLHFLGEKGSKQFRDYCYKVSGVAPWTQFPALQTYHLILITAHSSPQAQVHVHSSINATKDAAPSTATILPTSISPM